MKKIYIAIGADILHTGHINVINAGSRLGEVTLGILSDEAIASYKRLPVFDYETRKSIFGNLKNVVDVIKQDTIDYTQNLELLKPDYVVHGDDWREGSQKLIREKVIHTLAQWGGQLVEVPYTKGLSATDTQALISKDLKAPDYRRGQLRRMLNLKPYVSVMEASNGLTGLIVENAKVYDEETSLSKEFDAMWISSLCDSTFKGKPDIELVDLTSRLNTINEVMEVTTKPIILDGDTGGKEEHFVFNVKTLERIGVSAIIIEDKTGLKKNSLFGTDVQQTLADPEEFAHKIKVGKNALTTRDFLIFARLESLIAGYGVDDALKRAKIYVEAGADGVMIHSKEKHGNDIIEFLEKFREYSKDIPVIVVPTTYNHLTEKELSDKGANIIIHANHLLRSAYPAMMKTAESILKYGRSKEADEYCMPVKQILNLIPGGK
ncbi:MAG: phosphoenolpyruvate mutase [Acholeplasma sp.]|nr:phosphoenolpyruvate mutase [Acholeplasma sp.]